jgi:cyclic beta-1,2-glucan synthetase
LLRLENGDRGPFAQLALPSLSASVAEWVAWVTTATGTIPSAPNSSSDRYEDPWWLHESEQRVHAIVALLTDYMPWLRPEFQPLREIPELLFKPESFAQTIEEAATFAEQLDMNLRRAWLRLIGNAQLLALGEQLQAALPAANEKLRSLSSALHSLAQTAERMAEETDFAFLSVPGRRILSIGYDVRAQKLHEACYDMIASEARIATFLGIARDQLPQQSWFKMGRDHAHAFGRFLLLSWTGTMFEYLMPALWMRSYPDTLISRTLAACVAVQRAFARQLNIPWGISESGASHTDDAGHYHYQAYGVPQIALFIEATAGPVISPYSTFLALGVDSLAAVQNLRHMDSAGWVGAFGFYEAADYSGKPAQPVLVREWMAHHQGMSLLAILNLLRDNIVQQWFHANPLVQANELLLHEMPVSNAILRARMNE